MVFLRILCRTQKYLRLILINNDETAVELTTYIENLEPQNGKNALFLTHLQSRNSCKMSTPIPVILCGAMKPVATLIRSLLQPEFNGQ